MQLKLLKPEDEGVEPTVIAEEFEMNWYSLSIANES